jgi:uncharacterized membrane protein YdbT with pleckstrin-like domain
MIAFYLTGFVIAVLAGAVAGGVSAAAEGKVKVVWIVVAVLVVLLFVVLVGMIRRISTTYTITSQRLTIHSGLLSRELHETRLERVQNVNSTQSLLERLLRIGTVDFDTAAGAEFDFSFRGVAGPRQIVRTVDRAIHAKQQTGPDV